MELELVIEAIEERVDGAIDRIANSTQPSAPEDNTVIFLEETGTLFHELANYLGNGIGLDRKTIARVGDIYSGLGRENVFGKKFPRDSGVAAAAELMLQKLDRYQSAYGTYTIIEEWMSNNFPDNNSSHTVIETKKEKKDDQRMPTNGRRSTNGKRRTGDRTRTEHKTGAEHKTRKDRLLLSDITTEKTNEMKGEINASKDAGLGEYAAVCYLRMAKYLEKAGYTLGAVEARMEATRIYDEINHPDILRRIDIIKYNVLLMEMLEKRASNRTRTDWWIVLGYENLKQAYNLAKANLGRKSIEESLANINSKMLARAQKYYPARERLLAPPRTS